MKSIIEIIIKGLLHVECVDIIGAITEPAIPPNPCDNPHKLNSVPRCFFGIKSVKTLYPIEPIQPRPIPVKI